MAKYTSLYREYRPKTFDEIIGQDHIVKTLKNQIKTGNISHAYLFTGTRGTGKTSTAKIFSLAVNCLDKQDSSPCYKCEACKSLVSTNLDIKEIDAASNSSVDSIRDLIDDVKYPPINCKYKVYIIDEVHMLSKPAFNALLKTLEEPPKYAIFVLATTELSNIPDTILSRCMRFDFKLIPTKVISKHLEGIFQLIKKDYEPEAVAEIANAGQGSLRDALSIADTVMAFCDNKITHKETISVLGISDPDKVIKLMKNVLLSEYSCMLYAYKEIVNAGKDVSILVNDLLSELSKLMYVKNCPSAKNELSIGQDHFEKLLEISKEVDNSKIINAMNKLSEVEIKVSKTRQPEILVESALIKAADISANLDVDGILMRLKKLETSDAKDIQRVVISQPQSDDGLTEYPKNKSLYKATNILSKMILYLRNSKSIDYDSLASASPESFVKDDVVHLIFNNEADYNVINNPNLKNRLYKFIIREYPSILGIEVEYIKLDSDKFVEAENKIKKMFPEDIITKE